MTHGAHRIFRLRTAGLQLAVILSVMTAAVTTVLGVHGVIQQKLYGLPSGLAYYVRVTIGEPLYSNATRATSKNTFNLLVDTGSSNTAVVTADCCRLTNAETYSCAASSTCVDRGRGVSVSYITGSWSGGIVEDTFSSAELGVIPSFPFAAITQEANFIQTGYDGIVGLAYKSIATPQSDPPAPYLETIDAARALPNVFSLLMCGALQSLLLRPMTLDDDFYAGELLLGGLTGAQGETYHRGDVLYTPLVQERWYNVIVTGLAVNGQRLSVRCSDINSPRSIIDSGTSNIAFPSSVYTAILNQLRAEVRKVLPTVDTSSFFSDQVPCCSSVCDPTNKDSPIFRLPSLSVSLARDEGQQITVKIPPEHLWRPILLSTNGGVRACRVFGLSEGEITLLGDVFMDGLLTVHDRAQQRLGLAVAQSCPNGVTSTKTIALEPLPAGVDSFCDCLSSADRRSNLVSAYLPFTGKPCFFWLWWMYVVVASLALIGLSLVVCLWVCLQRKRHQRRLRALRQRNPSDGLGRQLITPPFDAVATPPAPRRPAPANRASASAAAAAAASGVSSPLPAAHATPYSPPPTRPSTSSNHSNRSSVGGGGGGGTGNGNRGAAPVAARIEMRPMGSSAVGPPLH